MCLAANYRNDLQNLPLSEKEEGGENGQQYMREMCCKRCLSKRRFYPFEVFDNKKQQHAFNNPVNLKENTRTVPIQHFMGLLTLRDQSLQTPIPHWYKTCACTLWWNETHKGIL